MGHAVPGPVRKQINKNTKTHVLSEPSSASNAAGQPEAWSYSENWNISCCADEVPDLLPALMECIRYGHASPGLV